MCNEYAEFVAVVLADVKCFGLWDIVLCGVVGMYRRFGGTQLLSVFKGTDDTVNHKISYHAIWC